MGCGTSSEFDYLNSAFEVEREIRRYEIEKLQFFKKIYSSIVSQLGTNSGLLDIIKTEQILRMNYSDEILKILEQMKKNVNGKEYYDANKIRNLVYLTCPDCIVKINNKDSHDKLGNFMYHCKEGFSDELFKPISKLENDLDSFIGELFDIACIDIVKVFCKSYNIEYKDYHDLSSVKTQFIKDYKDHIFNVDNKNVDEICFEDLQKIFQKNPMILTTGDMREMAFKLIHAPN